jgi:hypothetical protein
VFWGGIICVFDLRFNGFDVVNDILGTVLVAWGVVRLAGVPVDSRYRSMMLFVEVVSLLSITEAVNAHVQYELPRAMVFLLHLYGIAKVAATVVFCLAMRRLCIAAALFRSQESWKTTTILFTVIYLIPWGLLHLVWLACLMTGGSFRFNLGPAALPILVIFFLPLIHLFVSTSRMRREAESLPDPRRGES